MKKTWTILLLLALACHATAQTARKTYLLREGWSFTRQDAAEFSATQCDVSDWQSVTVPHDWAIYGPFDSNNDLQFMAIEQDGQRQAQHQSGRTGGLPFIGVGWYRRTFDIPEWDKDKQVILKFDGAMSHARVYVNGKEAGYWPYGYNTFYFDVTGLVQEKGNTLAVRLDNPTDFSRWYPGAGLYRNVHLIVTGKVAVKMWGTQVTTPVVNEAFAKVKMATELELPEDVAPRRVMVHTRLLTADGTTVAEQQTALTPYDGATVEQDFVVERPQLWDCDHPNLYTARTQVFCDNVLSDTYETVFGIRSIEVVPDQGFFLNGKKVLFRGTCNHHDLGPLGTAVNEQAIRYRLQLLKDMGCNAYRTSHNMPSPELVKACNEMGMMLMVESFDEWQSRKMRNGYNKLFNEWIGRDVENMVLHFRNDPSVVMWCIGNEVPDQGARNGSKNCRMIRDICRRLDPTRPCTMGMDRVEDAIKNQVAAVLDIPGFNYRSHLIQSAYSRLPQQVVVGSETASTVSSRGVYKFPVQRTSNARYDDHQMSSYDVEHCSWSDLPEDNFILTDLPYYMGEFVWTGFDYLGEPTPYYNNWPSHSSLFGIIDLAYLPKDRYYLYRSVWNEKDETLHILPHWNWKGREGEVTPVFVYSSYPTVELFINGKSQGKRTKDLQVKVDETENDSARKAFARQKRYRLMWMDTKYEPGTVKAVAYDEQGNVCMEKELHTAGKPYRIELVSNKTEMASDLRDEDLAFVTVRVVDRDGNLCPDASNSIRFDVSGAGHYKAGANGNPISLESFQHPEMSVFNGQMMAIIAAKEAGNIRVKATAKGLKSAQLTLTVK